MSLFPLLCENCVLIALYIFAFDYFEAVYKWVFVCRLTFRKNNFGKTHYVGNPIYLEEVVREPDFTIDFNLSVDAAMRRRTPTSFLETGFMLRDQN